jgi:ABC-type transport system involved in multi-copper enzyme maturation permease subunit
MKTLSLGYGRVPQAVWLLLLVPPLIGLGIPTETEGGSPWKALGMRLVLAAVVLLPLFLGRSPRSLRLRKEMRFQLPGAMIALLGPGVAGWNASDGATAFAVGFLLLGCLLIGATSFGSEFEHRTMGSLLTQPMRRSVLFLEKLAVSGFLIVAAYLNLMFTLVPLPASRLSLDDGLSVGVYALLPLFSGAWFSLISRSTLAGVVFSGSVPGILFGLAYAVIDGISRLVSDRIGIPSGTKDWLLGFGFVFYLGSTLFLGWRTFARLEVREGGAGGRTTSGMHPLSRPLDQLLARLLPTGSNTAQLLRKELRLHVIPWLMTCVMLGMWLILLLLRSMTTGEFRELNDPLLLMVFGGILGAVALVGAGAASVAEERELGTLDWQLTQPGSLGRQWWIKVTVAFALGTGVGVGVPAGLVWLSFPAERLDEIFKEVGGLAFASYATGLGLLLIISILASSICRNTMKATAATVGIGGGIAGAILLGVEWFRLAINETAVGWRFAEQANWEPKIFNPGATIFVLGWRLSAGQANWGFTLLLVGFALLVLGVGLLKLAQRNHRRTSIPASVVVWQLVGVMVVTCLLVRMVGGGLQGMIWLTRRLATASAADHLPDGGLTAEAAVVPAGTVPELSRRYGAPISSSSPVHGVPARMDAEMALRYGLMESSAPRVTPASDR